MSSSSDKSFWSTSSWVVYMYFRHLHQQWPYWSNDWKRHKENHQNRFLFYCLHVLYTQLFVASLLSKSFFWRISPTPPGAPNFSTMAFVFLNWSSPTRCRRHFKYVSRVCFSGGTGTFGSTWYHKVNRLMWWKGSSCLAFLSLSRGSLRVQELQRRVHPFTCCLFNIRIWINN